MNRGCVFRESQRLPQLVVASGQNKTWHETDWFATTHSPGPWAILDLGSVCDLETISIWNAIPAAIFGKALSPNWMFMYAKISDRNNTHENLAAFNPEGWTLLKSDLAVKPNPGAPWWITVGLLTGEPTSRE